MRRMFFCSFDQERERIKNYSEITKKVSAFSWCFFLSGCALGLQQEMDFKSFDSADSDGISEEKTPAGMVLHQEILQRNFFWRKYDRGKFSEGQYSDEICNDGIDNDGDTLVDCADNDCFFLGGLPTR